MPGLDPDLIRYALETAERHGFRVVKLQSDGETFRAVLGERAESEEEDTLTLAVADLLEPAAVEATFTVKSPGVGYFTRLEVSPEIGATVEPAQVVGALSALGLKNDIVASKGGTVTEWLVESGAPVEFGQPILRMKL